MNHKNKSKIKASGMRSAFVANGKVVTTSFGKGNSAVLEKEVADNIVSDINNEESSFELSVVAKSCGKNPEHKNEYRIKGKWLGETVVGDDPYEYSMVKTEEEVRVGLDVIHAKDNIEKIIFGKSYPDDNIHIQLAYNILDIKKVLAIFANNTIFSLNNLRHQAGDDDFVGTFFSGNTWKEVENVDLIKDKAYRERIKKQADKFDSFMYDVEPYMDYHPTVFYEQIKQDKKCSVEMRSDKDLYDILRILSDIRQSCVHNFDSLYIYDKLTDSDPYHLREKRAFLDKLYDDKINDVNKNFIKNNTTNLFILFRLYHLSSDKDKSETTGQFYDFVVTQKAKNLGFSLKTVREMIIEKYVQKIKNKEYDSLRQKLYTLIDFILYKYYIDAENVDIADSFVNGLRASVSEERKAEIYENQGAAAYSSLKKTLDILLEYVQKDTIKKIISDAKKEKLDINCANIKVKSSVSYFTKLMYLLTLFLDGKEINELISTLINKFDNIASFISVMKKYNMECSFYGNYTLFEKSSQIAGELRILKSFARMKTEIPKITSEIYDDAVYILGLKDSNGSIIREYTDGDTYYLHNYVDNLILDIQDSDGEKRNTKLRNFLINNVIKSRRFWYVIRYINPCSARRIMSSEAIVKFVLGRLPDTQITRYYESVSENKSGGDRDKELSFLCERIVNMNINQFEDVPQSDPKENIKKERYKAVIGLYLTVLYLFTKNLVNINARYTIACCCLERDRYVHKLTSKDLPPHVLTEKAISEKWINKRYREYFRNNYSKIYDPQMYGLFRNKVVHLNAVMDAASYIDGIENIDSYFMVYHYIMQRCIDSFLYESCKSEEYKKQIKLAAKHNTYSKDIVKGLCYPFGYNLSRFKNLTVMEVFNRKEILEERKKAERENADKNQPCMI